MYYLNFYYYYFYYCCYFIFYYYYLDFYYYILLLLNFFYYLDFYCINILISLFLFHYNDYYARCNRSKPHRREAGYPKKGSTVPFVRLGLRRLQNRTSFLGAITMKDIWYAPCAIGHYSRAFRDRGQNCGDSIRDLR